MTASPTLSSPALTAPRVAFPRAASVARDNLLGISFGSVSDSEAGTLGDDGAVAEVSEAM